MTMRILGIETSVSRGSIALCEGEQLSQCELPPREHTEQIIAQIAAMLEQRELALDQLDAIAFGRGPGSFVGVRLAAAVAQGLATAAGISLAPVSSMAALALRAAESLAPAQDLPVVVCLDARMNEVYMAQFHWHAGVIETSSAEQLLEPAAVSFPDTGEWLAVGSGFDVWPELAKTAVAGGARLAEQIEPQAAQLLPFARDAVRQRRLVAPDSLRSEYLRDDSAWQRME